MARIVVVGEENLKEVQKELEAQNWIAKIADVKDLKEEILKDADLLVLDEASAKKLDEKLFDIIKHLDLSLIILANTMSIPEKVEEMAFSILQKPWGREKLRVAVKNALKHRQLMETIEKFRREEEKKYFLVGRSKVMEKLWDEIRKVAASDATVLLMGESGTGKELVARAIHKLSRRCQGPFVRVNCAAIPEELIESELFGHEKGSFTGAYEQKIGKFELAHGGTLFLDEIADMSLKTQAKVLRAIETGEIQRIGSNKIINVNVRIIAATNKNLEELIKRGEFREDLYYRISVVVIKTPPLRKRKEDIPLLVKHFIELFSEENNYPRKQFTERAMAALMNYHWPGNVRELKNIVERLLTMTDSDVIDITDIPDYIIASVDEEKSSVFRAQTLQEFKERAERMFIIQKLKENNWNIKKTAEAIGTPRSNLYRKLIQYGIIKKPPQKEVEEE